MPRECKVCAHPERDAIDAALVCGDSQRSLAARYGLTPSSVARHYRNHVSAALAALTTERTERTEQAGGGALLDRVEALIRRAERILDAAEGDGKVSTALSAIKELRALLELLGKATGELDDRPQVTINLLSSPEWLQMRSQLLGALAPFPQARIAAADVLELPAADVTEDEA